MKKRSVVIFAVLVIVIGIGILVSTQFGIKKEEDIVVGAPIYEVSPVLTDLSNWPAWFEGADKYRFQVIDRNPAGITVKAQRANTKSVYSIVAWPDSIPSRTHIKWTMLISGFDWMKQEFVDRGDLPRARLGELKQYFESPKEFYGFDIKMGKVEDTLVLTKEEMVKKTGVVPGLSQLYSELETYAGKEHLRTNIDSCRMATFYDQKGDSERIAAGIPVATRESPLPAGMRLLEMPPHGKMLIGKYQGPYAGIGRLYSAMRKYVFDKKLRVVGAPYEKFLSPARSPADSLNMTIELHFPVL